MNFLKVSISELFIETPRLRLRPFDLSDIIPAYEMNLDVQVSQYTGDGGVVSKEEIERRIIEDVLGDYKKHGFGRLAIEWKENKEFIGFAGLKFLEDQDEVDLGYRLRRNYWGRGIATEAGKACLEFGFSKLKLEQLIAMIIPANLKSENVLLKLGMRFFEYRMEEDEKVKVFRIEKKQFFQRSKIS